MLLQLLLLASLQYRVDFTPNSISCEEGQKVPVSAAVYRRNRPVNERVSFFTNNSSLATIARVNDRAANVSCTKVGKTHVGAGYKGKRDSSATAVCSAAPNTLVASPDSAMFEEAGDSADVTVLVTNACDHIDSMSTVSPLSRNASIVTSETISKRLFRLRATGEGSTVVTFTLGALKDSVRVCVGDTTLTVAPPTFTVSVGGTSGQTATITSCGAGAIGGTVSWISRTPAVATIASSGAQTATVTGVAPGTSWMVGSLGSRSDSSLGTVVSVTASCDGVEVDPGESIQAAATAAGTGDTICVMPGTHRFQQVSPKANQVFLGEPGLSIMTGARVLTSWTVSGAYWYASGQTQQVTFDPNFTCQPGHSGCAYPEQLWVNGELYEHVTTLSAVTAGSKKWFFNYSSDQIFIPIDPSGKTIQTSVTQYAFAGSAGGVTVKHLVVERYSNEDQRAVVNYGTGGAGGSWTIDSNTIRYNHGVGATIGTNGKIRGNEIYEQGQAGYMAFGTNPLVEDNYIHHNNTAKFGPGPFGMAGGGKAVLTTSLIVRNNVATHNDGPGLWTDINNVDCLYEGNRVDSNGWRGIFHEISYDCVIRNNTVRFNGHDYPGSSVGAFEGAGILVSNSRNVEVYGNVVEDNRNGILGREEDRPQHPSGLGAHNILNLWVHDNTVKQLGSSSAGRAAGITDNDPSWNPHAPGSNNVWEDNDYTCNGSTKWRWAPNSDISKAAWLALPQDAGSTFSGC